MGLVVNVLAIKPASAEFRFAPYAAINGAVSRVDPDAGSSGLDVEDSSDFGFGVRLGADLFDRFSIEAGFTDLGSATLDGPAIGEEDIDYSAIGVSALYHVLGDAQDIADRNGLWAYLRLGVNQIDNDSNLELEDEDNVAVWAGAGVEYSVTSQLAVRAEIATFDGDAQAVSAGLVYRPFNSRSKGGVQQPTISRPPVQAPAPSRQPGETPEPLAEPRRLPVPTAPAPSIEPRGPIASSGCETPVFNEPVNQNGCAQLSGVQSGLQFVAETAQLTQDSTLSIANLAAALQAAPQLRVEIRAHASANGGPAAAQEVSRQRVLVVARALVAAGVAIDRLGARAFGSEQPRVRQGALSGQFLPDRIEFVVQP